MGSERLRAWPPKRIALSRSAEATRMRAEGLPIALTRPLSARRAYGFTVPLT
jgi:hypothetical protein